MAGQISAGAGDADYALSRKLALTLLALFLASCASYDTAAQLAQAPYRVPVTSGQIENPEIDESSGLAASRRDPDVLWTFNDSGGKPVIFAMGTDGKDLGSFRIEGAKNRDWEDMAAFRREGAPYLLIADVGDNRGTWDYVTLYVVREPEIRRPASPKPPAVPLAWTVRFQYEDGPRDCEAVAVDEKAGKILLITKRDVPPGFYTLPLAPGDDSIRVAWKAGTVAGLPAPNLVERGTSPIMGGYADMVTAMDVSPDGAKAMILTYKRAYLFGRRPEEPWAAAFARPPKKINLPPLSQAEGACFGSDEASIYVSSEKRPAPLLRIQPEWNTRP